MAATWPLDLLKRVEKGNPLSATDYDNNLSKIEDNVNYLAAQLLSRYNSFSDAILVMNTLGKSLIIDQPVDLGGGTVDCLGVGLVWLSEGNVITNGTLNVDGCSLTAGIYKLLEPSNLTLTGQLRNETFYLEWVGALGTGDIDDTAACEYVLKDRTFNLVNMHITLLGMYGYSRVLFLESNTTIEGNGFTTGFKALNGLGLRLMVQSELNYKENIHLKNFKTYNYGYPATDNDNDNGIYLNGIKHSSIEGTWHENARGHGIYARNYKDLTITNVYCKNIREQGIAATHGDELTLNMISGEGIGSHLIDIEPNAGDVVNDLNISNVMYLEPVVHSAVTLYGSTRDQINNVNLNNIRCSGLAVSNATNVNLNNVYIQGNDTIMDGYLVIFLCDTVSFNNTIVKGAADVSRRGAYITNSSNIFGEIITDVTDIGVDILQVENAKFKVIANNTPIGVRQRDGQHIQWDINTSASSYGFLITSADWGNKSTDLNLQLSGQAEYGIRMEGDVGDIHITGDVAEAAVKVSQSSTTFDGVVSYDNLIGYKRIMYMNAPPTSGAYSVGELVYKNNPVPGGMLGWVCTTAGSPGTWKNFGNIDT
jgi:hypothetical protein